MFSARKKFIQGLYKLRVSILQNLNFWLNYPFKSTFLTIGLQTNGNDLLLKENDGSFRSIIMTFVDF